MGNQTLIGDDKDTWGYRDEPLNPNSGLLTLKKSSADDDAFFE